MTTDWREFFPLPTPRPEQVKILDELCQHFIDGKRFIVLESGTGSGKSVIAVCISRWIAANFPTELEQCHGGAIITSQKTLQDQYTRDFKMVAADLRSSANYPCKWTDGVNCAEVSRIYRATGMWPCKTALECDKSLTCPYKLAKSQYTESTVGITNYSFLMSEATYAGILKPRQLVVLDECLRENTKILVDHGQEYSAEYVYAAPEITHVLSFNETTCTYEKKRIIRKLRSEYTDQTEWITLGLEFENQKTTLTVTSNHKIWTKNRGYIQASNLTLDDVLKFDLSPKENLTQKSAASKSLREIRAKHRNTHITCPTCTRSFDPQAYAFHERSILKIMPCQTCSVPMEITHSYPNQKYCCVRCAQSSSEIRQKSSQRMLLHNPMFKLETRLKMRRSCKEKWNCKSDAEKTTIIRRFMLAPRHQYRSIPNKLEQFIIDLNLDNVRFVGLGDLWLKFKNGKKKNPDFIIDGTSKVIEIGDIYFWHTQEEIDDVIKSYAEIGYDCLYVTNKNLKDDREKVIDSIMKFVYNHDVKLTSIKKLNRSNQFRHDKVHYKYNFEIEDNHNYFANSILVSNCHRIEEEVRKWATVHVDESLATGLNICFPSDDETEAQVLDWMATKYGPTLEKAAEDCMKQLKAWQGKGKRLPPQLRTLAKLHEYLDKKKCQYNRWALDKADLRTEYILVRSDRCGATPRTIELKPLDIASGAHDVLYSRGQRVLMMSATILDFESFSRTCGLPKDTVFISVPSPFDPKNFGIVYRPIAPMNKTMIDQSIPKVVAEVRNILAAHPKDKGLIHVANYSVARAIGAINDPRLLVQTTGRDREVILKTHIESTEPTVLVSPAMMEGLDLYDDLGRFQIICKVPFPFLGDPVIKRLLERSQRWYAWRTALTLVQAVGRCVRNESDWTKTYILDENFGSFFGRWTSFFTNAFSAMDVDGRHVQSQQKKKYSSNWKKRY